MSQQEATTTISANVEHHVTTYLPATGTCKFVSAHGKETHSALLLSKQNSLLVPFFFQSQNLLFCYNATTGVLDLLTYVKEHEFEKLATFALDAKYTVLVPYSHLNDLFYLVFSSITGKCRLLKLDIPSKSNVELVNTKWNTEWTLFVPFQFQGSWHYLCYKQGSGAYSVCQHLYDGSYVEVHSGELIPGITCATAYYDAKTKEPIVVVYEPASQTASFFKVEYDSLFPINTGMPIGAVSQLLVTQQQLLLSYDQVSGAVNYYDLTTVANQDLSLVATVAGDTQAILFSFVTVPYFTVMTFNIWVSGSHVHNGLAAVSQVIREHSADIVGVQETSSESFATLKKLLQDVYPYGEYAANVLSKNKIEKIYSKPHINGYGVGIQMPNIGMLRMINSHLVAYPYGPYTVREGKDAVTSSLSLQGSDMNKIVHALVQQPSMDAHLPTILVGDHNIPSHLDFTEATVQSKEFARVRNYPATHTAWPVSIILQKLGFVDCYRQVFPDASKQFGFTWSPGYPKGTLKHDEIHDRIDFIYHHANTANFQFRAYHAYTIDTISNCNFLYPSDHRAVVTRIAVYYPGIEQALFPFEK